jgi:hypothetical protein
MLQDRKPCTVKTRRTQRRRKERRKADFIAKNSILPLAFVFLCVLRVFAVQISLILQRSRIEEGVSMPLFL